MLTAVVQFFVEKVIYRMSLRSRVPSEQNEKRINKHDNTLISFTCSLQIETYSDHLNSLGEQLKLEYNKINNSNILLYNTNHA